MIECHVAVAEEIAMLRNFYPIAASVFIHSRQTSVGVSLPRINHVPHVLASADLAQVLDAVVHAVAVDVVYLQRRKPPMVPSPNGPMHPDYCTPATEINI